MAAKAKPKAEITTPMRKIIKFLKEVRKQINENRLVLPFAPLATILHAGTGLAFGEINQAVDALVAQKLAVLVDRNPYTWIELTPEGNAVKARVGTNKKEEDAEEKAARRRLEARRQAAEAAERRRQEAEEREAARTEAERLRAEREAAMIAEALQQGPALSLNQFRHGVRPRLPNEVTAFVLLVLLGGAPNGRIHDRSGRAASILHGSSPVPKSSVNTALALLKIRGSVAVDRRGKRTFEIKLLDEGWWELEDKEGQRLAVLALQKHWDDTSVLTLPVRVPKPDSHPQSMPTRIKILQLLAEQPGGELLSEEGFAVRPLKNELGLSNFGVNQQLSTHLSARRIELTRSSKRTYRIAITRVGRRHLAEYLAAHLPTAPSPP